MKALKSIASLFTRKKFDDSTSYRIRFEGGQWELQYKTSSATIWRCFQTYAHMEQAMEDKRYFQSFNSK